MGALAVVDFLLGEGNYEFTETSANRSSSLSLTLGLSLWPG